MRALPVELVTLGLLHTLNELLLVEYNTCLNVLDVLMLHILLHFISNLRVVFLKDSPVLFPNEVPIYFVAAFV